MTTTTGTTYARRPGSRDGTSHVLLRDACGQLTLERLRPWHRLLAHLAAARLDRQLAAGASPESSAILAARAAQLTTTKVRRELATSLRRILAAAGASPEVTLITARPARLPLARTHIRAMAGPIVILATCLTAPGPVSAQGVAMTSQLLEDGTGPLYRQARGDELHDAVMQAARALVP